MWKESQTEMTIRGQSLLGLLWLCLAIGASPIRETLGAQETIEYLHPAAFSNLPVQFRERLEARGCAIPQENYEGNQKPSNVIQGEFARRGQKDWAVLCSRNGNSSIVLSWGHPTACPSELASEPDGNYTSLQPPEYDREISPITPKDIIGLSVVGGGDGVHPPRDYPVLDHQGIEDSFLGKGSVIYFCAKGRWVQLQGAD